MHRKDAHPEEAQLARSLQQMWPHREHESGALRALMCRLGMHLWLQPEGAFKKCCLKYGRFDGSNRNYFFPRVVQTMGPATYFFRWSRYTGNMIRVFRPVPVDRLKLLVFDLDGTLIDSAQDLCNSVNATLENFGRPKLSDEIIAGYIGNGALMLVRRAFAADDGREPNEELLTEAYKFFLDYYREHKLDYTYAYEGVLEALKALHQVHDQLDVPARAMAVLTNKPVRPAMAICEALGLAPYFLRIYGGNSFVTKKPDPEGLLALMKDAGATPEQTVMIGDSQVDVLTARNAGAWVIGCTFGLAPGSLEAVPPDVLVDSPADWTAALSPARIDS